VPPCLQMTTICTIGHGNRAIEEFVALLRQSDIEYLVDVRAFPASRRHPQFAREALERALADAGIHYLWEGVGLGGRRRAAANSLHTALRNPSFRAYADHMMQTEFQAALDRLITLGKGHHAAVMCAERLPWHCHRYLISDSLVARDIPVVHIVSREQTKLHGLSSLARVKGDVLIYDLGTQSDFGLSQP
jgi:uncharacterized protein (DUF488 family)